MADAPKRWEWRGWHFFAMVVLAVAVIGGVWSVIELGDAPAPSPGTTRTPTVGTTP